MLTKRMLLGLAAGGCLLAPATANAATASLTSKGNDGLTVTTATLEAAPGEKNVIDVVIGAADVAFTDTGANPTAGAGCTALLMTARCPLPAPATDGIGFLILRVKGGDGDDTIHVETPNGTTYTFVLAAADGGPGADAITVDSNAFDPNSSSDTLPTGILFGLLSGDDGPDTLTGGAGGDMLTGGADSDVLHGGAGDDTLDGDGSSYSDIYAKLFDSLGSDSSSDDDDSALKPPTPAALAPDTIDGGSGEDTLSYAGRADPVTVDLAAPGGEDASTGMEDVAGGDGANTITGDDGPNVLSGGDAADALTGNGGADTLIGGDGANTLSGGAGDDLLQGVGNATSCGAGTDKLLPGSGKPLNGVRLRKDCELLVVDPSTGAAIRLTKVGRAKGALTIAATLVADQDSSNGLGSLMASMDGSSSARPKAPQLEAVVTRHGHRVAAGSVAIPAKKGAFTLTAKLTTKARRTNLKGVSKVRVAFKGSGSTVTVDLPLASH